MSNSSNENSLKRVVGVSGLSLNIINITIGAGIFALPAIVGIELGAFSVFAYLFCGVMMATIMLCYAEIGTQITDSGGSYAYVVAAFGEFPGYLVNWLSVFGWSILGSAALMNIIANSLTAIFPSLSNILVRALLFFLLLSLLVLTNVRGAKESVKFIKWITIIKILPLICIIIFGITLIDTENLSLSNTPSLNTFSNTTLILFFAFAGFETALGASGEIINPKRTIPLGILIGGGTVLIIYLLLQTVTQGILGGELESVKDAPLAAVADNIVGAIGGTLILIVTAISCFGAVSSDVLNTPRVLFAGANDGLFPKFLGSVHPKFSTPYWSIIIFSALMFLFSVFGGFEQLAVLASTAILLIYLFVILAMIKLRLQNPKNSKNNFRVPGGLVIPLAGIVAIIWLLSSLSKTDMLSSLLFIAIVSIIYIIKMKLFH